MSALAANSAAPSGRPRRARLASRGVPAAVSVLAHAATLVLAGFLVYRSAAPTRDPAERITIDFAAPGTTVDAMPAAGAAAATIGEVSGAAGGEGSEGATLTPPPAITELRGLASVVEAHPGAERSWATGGVLAGGSGAFVDPADAEAFPEGVDAPRGVTFAGLGASTARSVVYAIDCSGSMVTSLPLVLEEVRRSVARLAPTQKFGVVLFARSGQRDQVRSFAPVLVRATPTARARLSEWLAEAVPAGRSAPLAGAEAALAFQPDAVFLLSRAIERSGGVSDEQNLTTILARLDQLNPAGDAGQRPVLIQTIQFLDEDPVGVLRAIGARHGGGPSGYRVVATPGQLGP